MSAKDDPLYPVDNPLKQYEAYGQNSPPTLAQIRERDLHGRHQTWTQDQLDRRELLRLLDESHAQIAELTTTLEDELGSHKDTDVRLRAEIATLHSQIDGLRVAVKWINEHAQHDESRGRCYGLVRARYIDDPPDMVYEEHKCKCGLDALKAAIGDLPPDPTEGG